MTLNELGTLLDTLTEAGYGGFTITIAHDGDWRNPHLAAPGDDGPWEISAVTIRYADQTVLILCGDPAAAET